MKEALVDIAYLASATFFIFGLKQLGSAETARRGNLLAEVGMLIAIVATLVKTGILNYTMILLGIVVGAGVGTVFALKVPMTGMPQMVALLNGFGGGASVLVAISEYFRQGGDLPTQTIVAITLSVFIGAVTFTGSLIAFAKLQEFMRGQPIVFPLQKTLNALLFLSLLAAAAYFVVEPGFKGYLWYLVAGASVLGVLLVIPIGGADMPVVISLLNSYSGLAAAMTGFVLNNYGLIVSGALVGSAGLILTQLMCRAMNRSLANVLFGAFGRVPGGAVGGERERRVVRECMADDAAIMLENARLVIVVPGYGMAVSQAQHAVAEMGELLQKKGVEVKYAIHPVAGRMPGHMNVLLAEANVPYEQLYDMDDINPEFEKADVALVIGANDVTNPAAKEDPKSPIYGMPILEVEKARAVIVLKRSLNPGFAGIGNELYYRQNTYMLFGDAKGSLTHLLSELKHS